MPRGLRASDAAEIRRRTGDDMRLLLRIGALLEAKLALTEAALDRLLGDATGHTLLSDRSLGNADADAFVTAARAAGIDDCIMLAADDPPWRVIALTDEVGNIFAAPPTVPATGMTALVETLAPALRDPVQGFMQARADDQRAAALERLRYAAPPLAVVGELMPMLLSDGAELVRERAIALIGAAGGHALIVDLVRAMQRRDDKELARLAPAAAALPPEQRDLAVSALVAQAGRGETTQGLIEVCTALAATLAGHRQLDRLLDILLPTSFSLIDLARALQQCDPARTREALRRSLGFGAAQDARIIVLFAAPGETGDDALLERGIDLLLESGEEPRSRMPLAAALRRLDPGNSLARRLAGRGMRLCQARDSSVYWLIGELCRDGAVDADSAELLADVLRRLLREAPGPHMIGALEQQLPIILPCPDAARARFVDPLIEVTGRYRAERTIDLVTNSILGIGALALPAVWEAAENHPIQHVRELAIGLLPALLASTEAAIRLAGCRRLLRGLDRAEQGSERGCLVAAAARVAATETVASDTALNLAVDQAAAGLGHHAYEALGFIAAAAGCAPARRAQLVEQLLAEACAELPDTPTATTTDAATGETTFELDERLAAHTEHVPQILTALARIGRSANCQPEVLQRLVERLVAQWRQVAAWRLVWGPGNVHALATNLAALAEGTSFPGPLRIRVVESMVPQISQLVVARLLARILTVAEGPYLARLAGRAADDLVRLAAKDHEFAEDEREELVETLVDFLAVPALGPDADAVRRRLVGVIASHRDHASSRTRARLRFVSAELPPEVAAKIDWA